MKKNFLSNKVSEAKDELCWYLNRIFIKQKNYFTSKKKNKANNLFSRKNGKAPFKAFCLSPFLLISLDDHKQYFIITK